MKSDFKKFKHSVIKWSILLLLLIGVVNFAFFGNSTVQLGLKAKNFQNNSIHFQDGSAHLQIQCYYDYSSTFSKDTHFAFEILKDGEIFLVGLKECDLSFNKNGVQTEFLKKGIYGTEFQWVLENMVIEKDDNLEISGKISAYYIVNGELTLLTFNIATNYISNTIPAVYNINLFIGISILEISFFILCCLILFKIKKKQYVHNLLTVSSIQQVAD